MKILPILVMLIGTGWIFTHAEVIILEISDSSNLSQGSGKDQLSSHSELETQLLGVLEDGPKTRDQLVKKLGIPRTTIYDGLKKLIINKEVKKYPLIVPNRGRGRPKVLFELNEDK
ncbi:hypothetical protein GF325_19110 [Candidatus Bathyarchaeota archaeon]|nr:hypothetical protein [Candidatus Bathyarchaeota archaeon]